MNSNGGENGVKPEVYEGFAREFCRRYRNVRIISLFSALRVRATVRSNYLHTKKLNNQMVERVDRFINKLFYVNKR